MTRARTEVLGKYLKAYPGQLRTSVQQVAAISGGGFRNADIQFVIGGPDLNKLTDYSNALLEKMKKTEAIDGLRYESVSSLRRDTDTLQGHISQFAKARGVQVSAWTRFEDRSFLDGAGAALDIATEKARWVLEATGEVIDAAKPALDIATETAGRALVAAGDGIVQASNLFTRRQPQKEAITKGEPVRQNGQTE